MEEEKHEEIMDMWASALKEQEEASKASQPQPEAKKEEPPAEISDKLKRFLDIPLQVEVVVGSTKMTLGELLYLWR